MGAQVPPLRLSDDQRATIALAAQGLTQSEVGERLYVTGDTIKTRTRRIFLLLGARTAAHAVALAHETGELPLKCCCPCGCRPERLTVPDFTPRPVRTPLPELAREIAEKYPSINWGEQEWGRELIANNDLFIDVLGGLAKTSARLRRQAK